MQRTAFRPFALAFAALVATSLAGSAVAVPDFHDATIESGLLWTQLTWGAQSVDLDRDGDLDLGSGHHFSSAYVHTNDGLGHFTVWGLPQIVSYTGDRHGFLFVDLDGDRFPEAICIHGGEGGCACDDDPNELWKSLGGGLFTQVAEVGAFADTSGRGRAVSAADVDGDGDLDLHVTKAPLDVSPNSLFRNDGGLAFVDVAAEWGLDETLGSVGSVFADTDDDGDPDLLVGGEEFERPTTFFRNDGGVFLDATASVFGTIPVVAGAEFGDYDGDGDLDLAVCEGSDAIYDMWAATPTTFRLFATHRHAEDGVDAFTFSTTGANPLASFRQNGYVAASLIFLGPAGVHPTSGTVTLTNAYVGAPAFTPGVSVGLFCWREFAGGPWQVRVSSPPGTYGNYSGEITASGGVADPGGSQLEHPALLAGRLIVYRNDGGVFTDVSVALGLTPSLNPRQVAWIDVENDGDLDLHLVNKGTAETGNESDVLWRNDGSTFAQVENEIPGIADHLSDGAVWGDLDRDGDLDVFLQEGAGPHFFSLGAPCVYYRNDGEAAHWLRVSLDAEGGATSVGAKVTAYAAGFAPHRRVQANSWRGFQQPAELHFGLGSAAIVDSLVVEWPSGAIDRLFDVPADRALHWQEGVSPTSVDSALPAPEFVALVHPQPSRASQRLAFIAPRPGPLRVDIYDVSGRRLRTILDSSIAPGEVVVDWDGRDAGGRLVPAGVYFWRGSGILSFERRGVRLR